MPYDKFLIGFNDSNASWQSDVKPWLINDNAFELLNNVYVWRGRVKKRFGSTYIIDGDPFSSRLRVQVGTIGSPTSPVPGNIFQVGQMFSVGTQLFNVITAGVNQPMLSTGPGTGTFSTTNGVFTLSGTGLPGGTPIYFYPSEPVMGLTQYEIGPINNHPTYAFDTQFAYFFTGQDWARSGTALWHGSNSDFVWAYNWYGITSDAIVLWVTNFNATVPAPAATDDPIWTFDGTNWVARTAPGANGIYFRPAGKARYMGPYVKTARMIIPFKDRLVLLSTIENDNPNGDGTLGTNTQYVNRARYSHNGSPFAQNAWYEENQSDTSGTAGGLSNADGGGFIDAATDEQIISAEFIKDRLIVYFERSTWELAYTGNQIIPFVWQKLNTELGSEGTFSTVPFDKAVLTMGTTGIHACNGSNVERIDNKIPNEIFDITQINDGISRVAGIRDYYTELVYWTFPSNLTSPESVFPNRVLVFNYKTGAWGINNDTITTFGYMFQQTGLTWANANMTWAEANFSWNDASNDERFRLLIGGNQQGFVFIIDADISRNESLLQITNMVLVPNGVQLTIINHSLELQADESSEFTDYISIEGAQGVTGINTDPNADIGIYRVTQVIDENNVVIDTTFTGTYTGGGYAARVSQIQILTKQWNPYTQDGRNFYLAKADFNVDKTQNGQITVEYFVSTADEGMAEQANANNVNMGNNILETTPYALVPLESKQIQLWHTVYFQADGEFVQFLLYMTTEQMMSPKIQWDNFELNAILLHTTKTSYRLQ